MALLAAPHGFSEVLAPCRRGTQIVRDDAVDQEDASFDVIVVIAPDRRRLEEKLPAVVPRLRSAGGLWLAWLRRENRASRSATCKARR